MQARTAFRAALPVEEEQQQQREHERGRSLGIESGGESGIHGDQPRDPFGLVPTVERVEARGKRGRQQHVATNRPGLPPEQRGRHENRGRPRGHASTVQPRGEQVREQNGDQARNTGRNTGGELVDVAERKRSGGDGPREQRRLFFVRLAVAVRGEVVVRLHHLATDLAETRLVGRPEVVAPGVGEEEHGGQAKQEPEALVAGDHASALSHGVGHLSVWAPCQTAASADSDCSRLTKQMLRA